MSKRDINLLNKVRLGYTTDKRGNIISPKGQINSLYDDGYGYLCFGSVRVHRFIAYLKFGDEIFSNEVRHLDNNSYNNTWSNIGIGTHLDNVLDIPQSERLRKACCGAAKVRRLLYSEANDLRLDKECGLTHRQLCIKYNVSKTTVSEIVNRKTYNIPQ